MNPTYRSAVYLSALISLGMMAACSGEKTVVNNYYVNSGGTSGIDAGGPSATSGGAAQATGGAAQATGGAQTASTHATGGAAQQSSAVGTGGATGGSAATGSTPATGGSPGNGCGTTNGSFTQNTLFATTGVTAPYGLTNWSSLPNVTLTQTTTNPTSSTISIDCSSGCALLHVPYLSGTASMSGLTMVQYIGSATNLVHETFTMQLAVDVIAEAGATAAPPVDISLLAFSGSTSYEYSTTYPFGALAALAPAAGFHTYTTNFVDSIGSSGATLCAAQVTSLAISVSNSAAITASNGATLDIYMQSISVAPGT
jgi:hypothetical protein